LMCRVLILYSDILRNFDLRISAIDGWTTQRKFSRSDWTYPSRSYSWHPSGIVEIHSSNKKCISFSFDCQQTVTSFTSQNDFIEKCLWK
jgi:hypothetical protein